METAVPSQLAETMKRQKYHLVGRHSAVKRCRWLHETLVKGRPCYKQKFYGIKTHQCIQMTPALFYCTQQCLFCWRAQNSDLQLAWDEMKLPRWDEPEEIVEGSIKEQHRILTGYKATTGVDKQKLEEAQTPKHVAISLTGKPTLYENLGELVRILHKKGFTTFLVSNGTLPLALSKLSEEPSQLHISTCASDEKTFKQVCQPQFPKAWKKLNETLQNLPSSKCPTVLRITLPRDLNMANIDGYAKIVEKAKPTYIEPKAYMYVGFSRLRMKFDNMSSHKEIYTFGEQLAKKTGYNLVDESTDSRVVLLSKFEKIRRFDSV
jgi:tRNA wybutosine-synthesizing protein 1